MESKWLNFEEHLSRSGKTRVVYVHNKSGEYLGEIKWYSHWRQYCFVVEHDHYEPLKLVLAKSCINDISAYIEQMMQERANLTESSSSAILYVD